MDLPSPSGDVLAQPTRARLFAVLVELKRAAGTEELADRLDRHPNGVRRHLELMREAGLIERRRMRGKKGRPGDRWLVAPGAHPGGTRPKAYADLAGWLARAIPAGPVRLRQIERSGREIGRDLAPEDRDDPLDTFRRIVTALGFQPELAVRRDGEFVCRLGNCPYRDSVRENADVVCMLHRGITVGLLAELDPEAKLTRFEPHDPERAGCLVEVAGGSWDAPSQSKRSSGSA
ncbi:MAG: helix-turn-helix transcriptional regulator [Solirubrobacterales bacterium]